MAKARGAHDAGAGGPASSFSSLERTLDRTIECLAGTPQSREARALLIEARRLRSVIANWRSIPPPADVRDEMLERVVQLSSAVGAAFPEALPEIAAAATEGPMLSGDEESEGYALDFEPQLYSLQAATNPNRRAIPVPPEVVADFAPPEPPETLELPANSEDEPTRAWSSAALKSDIPPDLEPIGSAPAPWPVEDPPDRISSVVVAAHPSNAPPPMPAPAAKLQVEPPAKAPIQAILDGGRPPMPPATGVAPVAQRESPPAPEPVRAPVPEPPPPRAPLASSADLDGRSSSPRIITYDFDPEGDDLSVPRTQIAAHAVRLSDPVDPLLVVLADAYSPRADAYRTLRRKLANTPTVRVIAVTSAEAGEGKSVFAVNLALSLRESSRSRVLIVEANLRAPGLGKLLGFDTPECFLAQLQRHAEDPRAPWVVAEPLPKLHVMAIDPAAPREPLLDPVTFSAGMERIKQAGYEYVVIDSPPVLGSLDCNVIADSVDGTILTALPMKSMRRQMRKAVEQLDPAPILGVVVLEG